MLEQGLRTGIRLLSRQRGFAGALILTLALGVGGVTAFFAVLYGAVLRPLPYPRAGELVLLQWQGPEGGSAHATTEARFRSWLTQPGPFASMAAHELKSAGKTVGDPAGEPRYVQTLTVSTSFFDTLEVSPFVGRAFEVADGYAGAACSVVVAQGFWRHQLAQQWPTTVRVGGEACEVVGVMPANFRFAPSAQVWMPLRAGSAGKSGEGANVYAVLARLHQKFDRYQAEAAANAMSLAVAGNEPRVAAREEIQLLPLSERLRNAGKARLWPLTLAGALVLLACWLNLSHLLVAYVTCRRQSLTLRRVLGATWTRIGTGLLTELSVPAGIGMLLGLLLAHGLLPLVMQMAPQALSEIATVRLGATELAFAVLMTGLCMVLVIAGSVARLARREQRAALNPGEELRACTRIVGTPLARRLVVLQVACSLTILCTTFLLYDNLQRLSRVDLGFDTEGVWTFQAPREGIRPAGGNQRFTDAVMERLRHLPGVTAAATTTSLPLEIGLNIPAEIDLLGEADSAGAAATTSVELRAVSPDYFRALGIHIEQGRGFAACDEVGSPPVAVVNQAFRRRFASSAPASVGQRLWLARGLGALSDAPREIVGIVADVRTAGPVAPPPPIVYVPRPQVPEALQQVIDQAFPVSFVVRHEAEHGLDPRRVQALVSEVEPWQAITASRGMPEVVAGALAGHRLHALLALMFGFLGVALSSLGVFGVTHADVLSRTREFGLRRAIGSRRRSLLLLVMQRVYGRTVPAILVALPLTFLAFKTLGTMVSFDDLWSSFGAATCSIVLTSGIAAFLPASRAACLDPLCALRSEES